MTARILVVEDDASQREQLSGFLRSARLGEPVDLAEASDAIAARAVLNGGGVDVVITDMRMPGGDGVDLVAWGRTHHPLVDFIVVTAYSSVETAVDAMRHGAHDFLTKPVNKLELLTRVKSLLRVSLLKRKLDQVLALRRRTAPDDRPEGDEATDEA